MKLLFAASISLLACTNVISAAEVKVRSPVALKHVFERVGPEFERSTGNKLTITWGESGGIRADVEKGEPFNVAFLTLGFVDELIKQGKLDTPPERPSPVLASVSSFAKAHPSPT